MKNKSFGNIFKGDKVIWVVFFFLCMVSIIEVFSASSSLSYKGGDYWSPILKHVGLIALGIFSMVIVLNIPCKYFKLFTAPLIAFSILTLLWVYFAGESTNGASRWISLLGIQFQPSEIAKGTLVLAVAQILSAMQTENGAHPKSFKYIGLVTLVITFFIFLENFSTAALAFTTVLLMMFIGRVPKKYIGATIGGVMLIAILGVSFVMLFGEEEKEIPEKQNLTEMSMPQQEEETSGGVFHRAGTWKGRIKKFFDNTEVAPKDFDLDKDGQIGHSNIAIASSDIIGKGPGNSTERDFLSQAFSDFIYSIIIEELGIIGAVLVALFYIILLYRTGRIANRCENSFPAFLAMGLALLLVLQALFNMLVSVGLAPVTGQPLPLISKGGTSTIINCIYIGVILSISRSARQRKDSTHESGNKANAKNLATFAKQ